MTWFKGEDWELLRHLPETIQTRASAFQHPL